MLQNFLMAVKSFITNDRKFRSLIFILVIFTGTGVIINYLSQWLFSSTNIFYDFGIYFTAAQAFLSGKDIYSVHYITSSAEWPPFVYLPITILLFIPFSYFPFEIAAVIALFTNVLLIAITTLAITLTLKHLGIILSSLEKVLIFFTILLFTPTLHNLNAGNANIIVLCAIALFYYLFIVKMNKNLSLLALSMAAIIKLWPAILILINCIEPRLNKLYVNFILILGFLGLASLTFFGIKNNVSFIQNLLNFENENIKLVTFDFFNPSIAPGKFGTGLWPDSFASMYNILLKLLSVSGLSFISTYISQTYIVIEIIFMLIILFIIYKMSRLTISSKFKNEFNVCVLSLLIVSPFIIMKATESYYGIYLILPCILFLYMVKLDFNAKVLLLSSIAISSLRQYIELFGRLQGGAIQSIIFIFNPQAIGFLLFFIFVLYVIRKYMMKSTI